METRQKILTNGIGWVVVLVLLGFLATTLSNFRERYRFKPEVRQEMRHLLSRVELGDSKARFGQVFTQGKYRTLRLRRPQSQKWLITTPLEIGSDNWYLYVEFDSKNRLGALRIRTEDSIHQRPSDAAPADRVARSWRRPFPEVKQRLNLRF